MAFTCWKRQKYAHFLWSVDGYFIVLIGISNCVDIQQCVGCEIVPVSAGVTQSLCFVSFELIDVVNEPVFYVFLTFCVHVLEVSPLRLRATLWLLLGGSKLN